MFTGDSFPRAKTVAYWGIPPLLAVLIYWPGLTSWFLKDDFAWLNLRNLVESWHDLWWALFAPLAQGTIRTLSERVFYMSFSSTFGIHPLPYRCFAFLTYAATLMLLTSVCTRFSGSRAAGFWAAILWTVNSAMAVALSWTAIYYQLLCSFFLLLTFWLLLRYVETGARRFYIAQCITFVVGFLVLELNVVYPALATVYALCCARRILGKVLPLFAISAAYTWVHMAVAPLKGSGPYKMYWDASVIPTLWTYWKMALVPSELIMPGVDWWRPLFIALLTIGLLAFLAWQLRRRRWIAAFFPAWFLIVLAPLLPLRDQINDSYLTIPLIGLAMWGGWALMSGWKAGPSGRLVAVALLVIYAAISVPVARVKTRDIHVEGKAAKRLILAVAGLSRGRPEKTVFLTGVSPGVFWAIAYHHPFRLFGIRNSYLLSENKPRILASPQLVDIDEFFLDPAAENKLLGSGQAVVYDLARDRVEDVTAAYQGERSKSSFERTAALVDVGNPLLDNQLGPTWYANEGGYRWMPKQATVKLRGPSKAGAKLYVKGFCPAIVLKAGLLKMKISIDGEPFRPEWVQVSEGQFAFEFDLPPQVSGRPVVEVSVELDHTFHQSSDARELGLAFGSFEIR